jgi:2-methylisocitrate lyase-like PEP mutase family enzyme
VSYGSGFTKAAITGAKRLAQEILEKGTCNLLKDGVQTPEIVAWVAKKNNSLKSI